MFKKLDQRVNLALTLAIIAGVSALLLSLVNNITAPVIAENQEQATLELYTEIFPDMTDYKEGDASDAVDSIVLIYNGSDEIGKICQASGQNAYGSITALVGYGPDNTIVNIKYSTFNQTPGFGDKVKTDDYINQYIGDDSSSLSAEAVSGATYSSKLVYSLVDTCSSEVE